MNKETFNVSAGWRKSSVPSVPSVPDEEVYYLTDKTIAYETAGSDYPRKTLMVGEYLGFGGISDFAKPSCEEIRRGSDSHYYSTTGFASHSWFQATDTLYDQDISPDRWTAGELAGRLNDGRVLVNHLGHGHYRYALKMSTGSLSLLTNTDPFFLYTQACLCGGFDQDDCWAEVLSTMETGAFALVANARYGFGARDSTDGPSQRFARRFWDALFGEGIDSIGKMNADAREDNIANIDEENIRWCYFQTNLFGDPALRIKDSAPTPFPSASASPSPSPSMTRSPPSSPSPAGTKTPTPSTPIVPSPTPSPPCAPSPLPTPHSPIPIPDFNGDGTGDIAVFRPETGLWAVREISPWRTIIPATAASIRPSSAPTPASGRSGGSPGSISAPPATSPSTVDTEWRVEAMNSKSPTP